MRTIKLFAYSILLLMWFLSPLFAGGFSSLPGLSEYTPLMRAASDGNLELVKKMISKGADINERGGNKTTALMAAVSTGRLEIVRMLLNKGADPHARSENNINAVTIVDCDSTEILKLLLNHNVDPNLKGRQGMFSAGPALSNAARCKKSDNLKVLLNKGKFSEKLIQSALYIASSYKNEESVSLLIMQKGQRVNAMAQKDGLVKRLYSDPSLDLQKLTNNEQTILEKLTYIELKALKNVIFARKGYVFSTMWLEIYFSTHFKEYNPRKKNVNLSKIDKRNINFLIELEKKSRK